MHIQNVSPPRMSPTNPPTYYPTYYLFKKIYYIFTHISIRTLSSLKLFKTYLLWLVN